MVWAKNLYEKINMQKKHKPKIWTYDRGLWFLNQKPKTIKTIFPTLV